MSTENIEDYATRPVTAGMAFSFVVMGFLTVVRILTTLGTPVFLCLWVVFESRVYLGLSLVAAAFWLVSTAAAKHMLRRACRS